MKRDIEITNAYSGIQFKAGDRFRNMWNGRTGIVKSLRNDKWEQQNSWNENRYHYSVDYDDGNFEAYEDQGCMIHI